MGTDGKLGSVVEPRGAFVQLKAPSGEIFSARVDGIAEVTRRKPREWNKTVKASAEQQQEEEADNDDDERSKRKAIAGKGKGKQTKDDDDNGEQDERSKRKAGDGDDDDDDRQEKEAVPILIQVLGGNTHARFLSRTVCS